MTTSKHEAAKTIISAVIDTLKEAKAVPSGHLYATLATAGMSLGSYDRMIDSLKDAGVVREEGHVIYWIG